MFRCHFGQLDHKGRARGCKAKTSKNRPFRPFFLMDRSRNDGKMGVCGGEERPSARFQAIFHILLSFGGADAYGYKVGTNEPPEALNT